MGRQALSEVSAVAQNFVCKVFDSRRSYKGRIVDVRPNRMKENFA